MFSSYWSTFKPIYQPTVPFLKATMHSSDFFDGSFHNHPTAIRNRLRAILDRAIEKQFAHSNLLNEESDIYNKSGEIHRKKTLEAIFKIYQGDVLFYLYFIRSCFTSFVGQF